MYKTTLEQLVTVRTCGEVLLVENLSADHWDAVEAVVVDVMSIYIVLVGKRTDSTDKTLEVDPCGGASVECGCDTLLLWLLLLLGLRLSDWNRLSCRLLCCKLIRCCWCDLRLLLLLLLLLLWCRLLLLLLLLWLRMKHNSSCWTMSWICCNALLSSQEDG